MKVMKPANPTRLNNRLLGKRRSSHIFPVGLKTIGINVVKNKPTVTKISTIDLLEE